jgi:hypothetical protein
LRDKAAAAPAVTEIKRLRPSSSPLRKKKNNNCVICEFGHRLTKLMAKKEEDNKERLAKVVFF